MPHSTRPTALADDSPQFQIARRADAVDEPVDKTAEDPGSVDEAPYSRGQEADDARFDIASKAPAGDEGSTKVAEDQDVGANFGR